MADWPDVMEARRDANDARTRAVALVEDLESGNTTSVPTAEAIATLRAAEAICAEIRALAVALAFEARA